MSELNKKQIGPAGHGSHSHPGGQDMDFSPDRAARHRHSHMHRARGEEICPACGYSHEGMKVDEKDGVVSIAGVRIVSGDYDALEEQAITEMEIFAQWVEQQGGMVGHIKTYLEERGSASSLTCVGSEVHVARTKEGNTNVILSAAILNLPAEKLRCRVAEFLGRMIL